MPLSGYSFAKQHTIDSSPDGALTDYVIRIKVDFGTGGVHHFRFEDCNNANLESRTKGLQGTELSSIWQSQNGGGFTGIGHHYIKNIQVASTRIGYDR